MLHTMPPAPSNNVSETVFSVQELMGMWVVQSKEVVEDTGGLHHEVHMAGLHVYGAKQYPPPGSSDAEGIFCTASADEKEKCCNSEWRRDTPWCLQGNGKCLQDKSSGVVMPSSCDRWAICHNVMKDYFPFSAILSPSFTAHCQKTVRKWDDGMNNPSSEFLRRRHLCSLFPCSTMYQLSLHYTILLQAAALEYCTVIVYRDSKCSTKFIFINPLSAQSRMTEKDGTPDEGLLLSTAVALWTLACVLSVSKRHSLSISASFIFSNVNYWTLLVSPLQPWSF